MSRASYSNHNNKHTADTKSTPSKHHRSAAAPREASLSAILASQLNQPEYSQSMDGRQSEYQQTGLPSPSPSSSYPRQPPEPASETTSTADSASAVPYQSGTHDYKQQQQQQQQQSNNFSSSATPTSEYGLPQSARSGSFPEYIQRSYAEGTPQQQHSSRYPPHPNGGHSAAAAMAQTSSPSLSISDGQQTNGHHHQHHHQHNSSMNSDGHVPIDPSIAQSSPAYPPPHNYSPYPPQHEMQQYPGQPMSYGRPDWAGQYPQHMYGHSPAAGGGPPSMGAHVSRPPAGGHPLSTVYSFVPIPGAQQHKRPRRRYEEIERMYKCGWNGCEKAYGTLNHLNAHVTMQSHGPKRTPEEFKEIRKEWKAKKKEEESQRKQEEERQRQEAARNGTDPNAPAHAQYGQPGMMPHQMGGPQLPPIGYQSAPGQAPGQYAAPEGQQYAYSAQGYPQSPYAQGGMPYSQHQAPSQSYQQQ